MNNINNPNQDPQEKISMLEKKIEFLIKTTHKINKTVNPPFYKRIANFVYHHFFGVLGFILILYFLIKYNKEMIKVWQAIDNLEDLKEFLSLKFSNMEIFITEKIEETKTLIKKIYEIILQIVNIIKDASSISDKFQKIKDIF